MLEPTAGGVAGSQEQWRAVRRHLQESRRHLTSMVLGHYPDVPRVADTPLLTRPDWVPDHPVRLSDLNLDFLSEASSSGSSDFRGLLGSQEASAGVRPLRTDASRYETYAAAMRELAPPKVFNNRSTYRLLRSTGSAEQLGLTFGTGAYFDGINTGEACAHEFAAAMLGRQQEELGRQQGDLLPHRGLPLREAIGDPCDPARRPINVAISTLTLRHNRTTGNATFFLHWRDPTKVGHAGGLYQVLPVGIFQASGDEPWNQRNDFDLWRCMVREFAEELLGHPEDQAGSGPIDYPAWPFARRLTDALDKDVKANFLGMGVDPLTLATDVLTVVVFDAALFDSVFDGLVSVNAEGRVLEALDFSEANVDRFVNSEPTQAAGAALLALAWRHRSLLLG